MELSSRTITVAVALYLLLGSAPHPAIAIAKPARKSPRAGAAARSEAPLGRGEALNAKKEQLAIPFRVRIDRITREDGLPQNGATAIAQDAFGFMWIGTEVGAIRYDGKSMRLPPSRDGKKLDIQTAWISAIATDDKSKVWIGTNGSGLAEYDASTDNYRVYRAETQKIDIDGINALYRGKNRLWIAAAAGLAWIDLDSGKFSTEDERIDDLAQPFTAVREDSTGAVWLGIADSDTIARFDPKAEKVTKIALGLPPHSAIYALAEDKQGDLWIGTSAGLVRRAAKTGELTRFQHDPANPSSLSDSSVISLLVDAAGELWAGTKTGHVDRLVDSRGASPEVGSGPGRMYGGAQDVRREPQGRFVSMSNDPTDPATLPQGWVLSLFEDRENVMWVGTRSGGIGKFGQRRRQFMPYNFGSAVGAVHGMKDGTAWAGLSQRGLLEISPDRARATLFCDDQVLLCRDAGGGYAWITDFSEGGANVLWAATDGKGLVEIDTAKEQLVHFGGLGNDRIESVENSGDGRLWLGTFGAGLLLFDPRNGKTERYSSDTNPPTLGSNAVYVVRRSTKQPNTLWLGTSGGGLVRFDTEKRTATGYVHDDADPESLSDTGNNVVSLLEDQDGAVWIGTWAGGLNRFDPSTNKFQRLGEASGLASPQILGMEIDAGGHLWLSTNQGISSFDPKSGRFSNFDVDDGLQGTEFTQGAHGHASTGELFFGGPDGMTGFRPGEVTTTERAPSVLVTGVKVFGVDMKLPTPAWEMDQISLSYRDSIVAIEFAGFSYGSKDGLRFEYRLEGVHDQWLTVAPGEPRVARYNSLSGGDYAFRVRAASRRSDWNEGAKPLRIRVSSPPWRTWWAYLAYAAVLAAIGGAFFAYQQRRIRVLRERARLADVEQELQLTGTIQSWFLPERTEFKDETSNIAGFYRPADRCSGDWWWHERLGDGRHRIFVGDVTGHGAGPALLTASVATLCRTQQTAIPPLPLDRGMRVLHEEIYRVCRGNYHMTMSAVEFDPRSRELSLVSAGGMPLMLLSGGAVHVISVPGTPLGAAGPFAPGYSQHTLKPGDRFVIYTDGIPETSRPTGRLLGNVWMKRVLQRMAGVAPRQAVEAMIQAVDKERGPARQDDDLTLVVADVS